MEMPSELSQYIQDFIRPTKKPVTELVGEIYNYFTDLEQYIYNRFQYKVGMVLCMKRKSYIIVEIRNKSIYLRCMHQPYSIKKYVKSALNIKNIEDKTPLVKRYIRTCNMITLTWSYLCERTDLTTKNFHKMIILKKYNKFWFSYI
jgi:hypothetical protein